MLLPELAPCQPKASRHGVTHLHAAAGCGDWKVSASRSGSASRYNYNQGRPTLGGLRWQAQDQAASSRRVAACAHRSARAAPTMPWWGW